MSSVLTDLVSPLTVDYLENRKNIYKLPTKMALSRPLLGVQSPIQCQLCTQGAKITWKCLECDLLMCSSCKTNVHSKFKTDKEHRIIDIKEIGLCDDTSQIIVHDELRIVGQIQTKFEYVACLAVSLDDSLWIGDGVHKRDITIFSSHTGLQKVKIVSDKLKVISSFNIEVFSISMTPDNDLLIVTEGPRIKQIENQASKITDSVFDFYPFEPVVVHVTRTNEIIVGVLNTSDRSYLVFVMNQFGKQERVYGHNPKKNVSFTQILTITDTSNNNIFVIDTINENFHGSVKVLGLDYIINTYSGHPAINAEYMPFTPSSLATTPADNVIIVDTHRNVLHILNSSGELITYIRTEDRGIKFPRSICLAMAGQFCILYIGTSVERDSKDKGQLYKLNVIGI